MIRTSESLTKRFNMAYYLLFQNHVDTPSNDTGIQLSCYTALAFGVFDGPQIHKRNPRPKLAAFLCLPVLSGGCANTRPVRGIARGRSCGGRQTTR